MPGPVPVTAPVPAPAVPAAAAAAAAAAVAVAVTAAVPLALLEPEVLPEPLSPAPFFSHLEVAVVLVQAVAAAERTYHSLNSILRPRRA